MRILSTKSSEFIIGDVKVLFKFKSSGENIKSYVVKDVGSFIFVFIMSVYLSIAASYTTHCLLLLNVINVKSFFH